MKKSIFWSVAAMLFFVSCTKENSEPSSITFTGTYDFVSMNVKGVSTTEYSAGGSTLKSESYSNYTTKDNTGIITITGSTIESNNIAYSVNSTMTAKTYQDGTLIDESSMPFVFDAPASSGTNSFRVVSADSVYFDGGSVFIDGTEMESAPSGAKFKVEGDMLYMTQHVLQAKTVSSGGIPASINYDFTTTISLKRK